MWNRLEASLQNLAAILLIRLWGVYTVERVSIFIYKYLSIP
jgi:hypothetical protein